MKSLVLSTILLESGNTQPVIVLQQGRTTAIKLGDTCLLSLLGGSIGRY